MTTSGYKPGSFGCHEALHMAAFLVNAVDSELTQHEAVRTNPEWLALADRAGEALMDLYQKIAEAHWDATGDGGQIDDLNVSN